MESGCSTIRPLALPLEKKQVLFYHTAAQLRYTGLVVRKCRTSSHEITTDYRLAIWQAWKDSIALDSSEGAVELGGGDNRRLRAHHESKAPKERQNHDASIAPSELCVGGRLGHGGSRRRLRSITPPELATGTVACRKRPVPAAYSTAITGNLHGTV